MSNNEGLKYNNISNFQGRGLLGPASSQNPELSSVKHQNTGVYPSHSGPPFGIHAPQMNHVRIFFGLSLSSGIKKKV